jgi:hypothetical protein
MMLENYDFQVQMINLHAPHTRRDPVATLAAGTLLHFDIMTGVHALK